jgi:hypothetical protein
MSPEWPLSDDSDLLVALSCVISTHANLQYDLGLGMQLASSAESMKLFVTGIRNARRISPVEATTTE